MTGLMAGRTCHPVQAVAAQVTQWEAVTHGLNADFGSRELLSVLFANGLHGDLNSGAPLLRLAATSRTLISVRSFLRQPLHAFGASERPRRATAATEKRNRSRVGRHCQLMHCAQSFALDWLIFRSSGAQRRSSEEGDRVKKSEEVRLRSRRVRVHIRSVKQRYCCSRQRATQRVQHT